jgi:hypothetical protein
MGARLFLQAHDEVIEFGAQSAAAGVFSDYSLDGQVSAEQGIAMRTFIASFFFPFCLLVSVFCLLAVPGCPRPITGPQPIPVSGPDAAGRGSATCLDVCANAGKLGCPAAQPTPNGTSCEEVCVNVMQSGIVTFDLACRAEASDCAAFERCE